VPPNGIWNVEWLNQNSQRAYPFSEEATVKDSTGSLTVPNNLIVDLVWPVHATASIEPDKFHLLSLNIFGNGVAITIGYDGTPIGSATVAEDTHTRNQSYFLVGTGDFSDSVGKITIGSLEETLNTPGAYTFTVAGGRFESTTIRPDLKGVTGLYVINSEGRSELLQGDIEFVAGQNVAFTIDEVTEPGVTRLVINAISGEGLNANCECLNLPDAGSPIKTINGIAPDSSGDFKLLGDSCLQLEGISNGIKITDDCSSSCCGCEELEPVLRELEEMRNQLRTIDGIAVSLDAQVNTALANVLASRLALGDSSCSSV